MALAGGLAGTATYAAQNLPLCGQSGSYIAWEDGPCVSPETSKFFDGVYRGTRGAFHRGQAVHDLASQHNRVFQPQSPRKSQPPREKKLKNPREELKVVSWNLHHGTSPDSTGARPQMSEMVQKLKQEHADIVLLQEVTPWDAQMLASGTGLVGYYSQTTPRQGNMMLVAPELEVTDNQRLTLNHPTGDREAAARVVDLSRGQEPRAVQAVRIQGKGWVFNTHLSTGSATPQDRAAEGKTLETFLQNLGRQGDPILGGGDLNLRRGAEFLGRLQQQGYEFDGATIDWLLVRGGELSGVESGNVANSKGERVSDHPMVRGEIRP